MGLGDVDGDCGCGSGGAEGVGWGSKFQPSGSQGPKNNPMDSSGLGFSVHTSSLFAMITTKGIFEKYLQSMQSGSYPLPLSSQSSEL